MQAAVAVAIAVCVGIFGTVVAIAVMWFTVGLIAGLILPDSAVGAMIALAIAMVSVGLLIGGWLAAFLQPHRWIISSFLAGGGAIVLQRISTSWAPTVGPETTELEVLMVMAGAGIGLAGGWFRVRRMQPA